MTTSIVGSAPKREGSCSLRSRRGVAVLDETYSYLVRSTAKDEDYLNVLSTEGLPMVGISPSPTGLGRCRSKVAERNAENPYYWVVKCDFSSEVEENESSNQGTDNPQQANPTAWLPVYETKYERLQEQSLVDINGDPIVNSAGALFPDGVTRTRKIPVWEFFQFEPADVDDEEMVDRSETVNSVEFKGRAAKTLLLTVLSSVVGYYYGQRLRFTQYQLKYKKDKWTQKRADVGHFYIDGTERVPYTDGSENVILGPLDGTGDKTALVTDKPAVLEFDVHDELNFSTFLRI